MGILRKFIGAVVSAAFACAPMAADAQGAMQQVTPVVPGHTVSAVQNGLFADGGSAQGSNINTGLSEFLLQARQNGQAPSAANGFLQGPFQNSGTGQFGSHDCQYAGSPKSPAGSYYLCMDADTIANGTAGGVISYGSIGTAPLLPFQFCINGSCLQFPFTGTGSGNVVGVPPTTIGGVTCFNNTVATLIKACDPTQPGGPAIAAVLPTVVDAPVCWDNTVGTLLITCSGGSGAGPNQVNTSNNSSVASFTNYLNLPNGPSFITSPTGNPTTGPLLGTFTTINSQGTTSNSNNREFQISCGLNITLGFGAANSNGDKVCIYAGVTLQAGGGFGWAGNFLSAREAASPASDLQTLEIDQNNFGQDTGGSDGALGLPSIVSYGISVSGVNDTNGFQNTGGIAIDSFGNAGGTLDAHGMTLNGFYKFNAIADFSTAPTYEVLYGGHTLGIDMSAASISGAAIKLPSNPSGGIAVEDTAGTALEKVIRGDGTNVFVCEANCAGLFINGAISPTTANALDIGGPSARWNTIFAETVDASLNMFINGNAVPTGAGAAGTCALWLTSTNLSSTPCANLTPDGTTIFVNGSAQLQAVAGPSNQAVAASSSSTTITPGQIAQANVALTSSTTFAIASGTTNGQLLKLRLAQDATGGRTVAFSSSVMFGTTVPSFTASTAANAVDYVGLEWDASLSKWVFLAFALGY